MSASNGKTGRVLRSGGSHRKRFYLGLSLIVSLLLSLFLSFASAPATVSADQSEPTASRPAPLVKVPTTLYFPETGHYLSGVFRNYWLRNGGLFQFGYPLTEEFDERNPADGKTYKVQYFERARFEAHPEFSGTAFEVELGLLGLQLTQGRQFATVAPFNSSSQRYYFPETKHSLSLGFKSYWDTHGGLAIYGYPISEEFKEANPDDGKTYTVQYFERARFEYHPENQGTPYEVLLGLLGTTTLQNQGRALPRTYTVNLSPGNVVQGRSLAVTVSGASSEAVKSNLNGVALNFTVLAPGLLGAVAPISSDAPLKAQLLRTEITDNTGIVRRFDQEVGVVAGQFEHQLIQLDPGVEAGLGTEEEQARERQRDFAIFGEVTSEKLWNGRFNWPLKGTITTPFATRRDYVGGGSEIHDGIDIGVPEGTPIRAPQRGKVVLAEFQKVRGNIVIIDHGLGLHSAYFHQSRILVKVGDTVNQGDLIGLVGTTGLSTGAHLHWEMRIGATGIDPQEWVNRSFL